VAVGWSSFRSSSGPVIAPMRVVGGSHAWYACPDADCAPGTLLRRPECPERLVRAGRPTQSVLPGVSRHLQPTLHGVSD
jgi:hypothetical protein